MVFVRIFLRLFIKSDQKAISLKYLVVSLSKSPEMQLQFTNCLLKAQTFNTIISTHNLLYQRS